MVVMRGRIANTLKYIYIVSLLLLFESHITCIYIELVTKILMVCFN